MCGPVKINVTSMQFRPVERVVENSLPLLGSKIMFLIKMSLELLKDCGFINCNQFLHFYVVKTNIFDPSV